MKSLLLQWWMRPTIGFFMLIHRNCEKSIFTFFVRHGSFHASFSCELLDTSTLKLPCLLNPLHPRRDDCQKTHPRFFVFSILTKANFVPTVGARGPTKNHTVKNFAALRDGKWPLQNVTK